MFHLRLRSLQYVFKKKLIAISVVTVTLNICLLLYQPLQVEL